MNLLPVFEWLEATAIGEMIRSGVVLDVAGTLLVAGWVTLLV